MPESPTHFDSGDRRRKTAADRPPTQRKRPRGAYLRMAILLPSLACAGLALPPSTGAAGSAVYIDGSTSVYPLMIQLAEAWHRATHQPTPHVGQGTSDVGINDVAKGKVDIGDSSRNPTTADSSLGHLFWVKIARDAVCLITNPANHLPNLSQEEIQQIYSGNVRDWSQVPGATVSGPIDLVDRIASSGTQAAFQDIFMTESVRISPSAEAEESNGLEQSKVAHDANAIGFVSMHFTAGLNAVGYQGVACTLRNAKSGQYQGERNFWMVTRGKPKGAALKFISWIINRHNATAHRIIASSWIPIN